MSFYQWKNCTFTTKDKKVNFNIKHLELGQRFFCAFVGSVNVIIKMSKKKHLKNA